MRTLYIASIDRKAGKTLIAAGLIEIRRRRGRTSAYIKTAGTGNNEPLDGDVEFMRTLAAGTYDQFTPHPAESAAPSAMANVDRENGTQPDLTIVETQTGVINPSDLEAEDRVLLVHDFYHEIVDSLEVCLELAGQLAGVLVNKVPRRHLSRDAAELAEYFQERQIAFLGVLPEDRRLLAPSINDLAAAVNGKILNNAEKGSELVENIMLGSSTFDRGAAYYNRKNNKAVLLWGERPGFRKAVISNYQLSALQTSTRCIIISHSGEPLPAVMEKATELKVPLISATGTLTEVVSALENYSARLQFHHPQKMPGLLAAMQENLDMRAIEAIMDQGFSTL